MYSTTLYDTPFDVAGRWSKRAWRAARSTIETRFGGKGTRNFNANTFALNACAPGRYVLKLGRGHGELARELKRKLCHVTSADLPISRRAAKTAASGEATAPVPRLPDNVGWFDEILLLDLLDQIGAPDVFMRELRQKMARRGSEVVITTGNVVSLIRRVLLALGGVRRTAAVRPKQDRRSFTIRSLRALLEEAGYEIVESRGIPMRSLAKGEANRWSRGCVKLNRALCRFSKHLFAHEICIRARPLPEVAAVIGKKQVEPAEIYHRPVKRVA